MLLIQISLCKKKFLFRVLSILFRVKFIKYNKKNEICELKTIFWGNFRLFDHLNRLQTGKRLV